MPVIDSDASGVEPARSGPASRDDLDARRARAAKGGRARRRCRAGRDEVVHERHRLRTRARRKGTAEIAPARGAGERRLVGSCVDSPERRARAEPEPPGEPAGENLRVVEASPAHVAPPSRHPRDHARVETAAPDLVDHGGDQWFRERSPGIELESEHEGARRVRVGPRGDDTSDVRKRLG